MTESVKPLNVTSKSPKLIPNGSFSIGDECVVTGLTKESGPDNNGNYHVHFHTTVDPVEGGTPSVNFSVAYDPVANKLFFTSSAPAGSGMAGITGIGTGIPGYRAYGTFPGVE